VECTIRLVRTNDNVIKRLVCDFLDCCSHSLVIIRADDSKYVTSGGDEGVGDNA
jgi:hypothetical protein